MIAAITGSGDDVGADDQKNAEYYEKHKGNCHMPGGGLVVLVRIHVWVPLKIIID
jgi:hypothetical protein